VTPDAPRERLTVVDSCRTHEEDRDGDSTPPLAALLELWENTGEPQVAVVRGEPGIGESRLVAELGAEVHRRGGTVALGVCFDRARPEVTPVSRGCAVRYPAST
jgi:putative protein kinase ArgK-like GTPase of G3E family